MAESGDKERKEIEADSGAQEPAKQPKSGAFRLWKKKSPSKEKPSDAVKLGCGGLFRRMKREPQEGGEPIEKPRKNKSIKGGTVKAEEAETEANGQSTTAATVAEAATKVEKKEDKEATDAPGSPPPIDTLPAANLLDAATTKSDPVEPAEPKQQLTKEVESELAVKSQPPARPANPPSRPIELAKKAEEKATAEEPIVKTSETDTAAVEESKAPERQEKERKAAEKAEEESVAVAKVDEENKAAVKAEEERKTAEKAEAEKNAEEKAEQEKKAAEKAEQERNAAEKAEQEKKAAEKAEQERKAAEKAEAEKNAAEKAEQEKKAEEKAEEEMKTPEKADTDMSNHSTEEDEEAKERQRLAELRFAEASVDMSKVSAKPGVKIEQSPHSEIWSTIVNKSFVGTGTFSKAAVCNLTTGGVLACNPADFTPTVEQVAALRDNFDNRGVFSAAGFGVADTVYQLQEETATDDILSGTDSGRTHAVLVAKTTTALITAVCTQQLDRAMEMLREMREHFITQGM